jgi:hypothetical protein
VIIELVAFATATAASAAGYVKSRNFVEHRLRFVDGVQKPAAPFVAGGVATAVALSVVAVIPVVAGGSALLFGAAVGLGTRAGARRIRSTERAW